MHPDSTTKPPQTQAIADTPASSDLAADSSPAGAQPAQPARYLEILGVCASRPSKTAQTAEGQSTRQNDPKNARRLRFLLQAAARELLPDSRVALCLRHSVPGAAAVYIWLSAERNRAYYTNLITCKKFWDCPVCAARITERKRERLTEALAGGQWFTAMASVTQGHTENESLAVGLDRLTQAYRRFTSGRWFQGFKDRFHIEASVRAVEVTHGARGWHVHYHVLFVSDSLWYPSQQFEMQALGSLRWQECLAKFGGFADLQYGFNMRFEDAAKAGYVAKLGDDDQLVKEFKAWTLADEITKAAVKKGRGTNRSLNQLLYDYATEGDEEAGRLWVEAAQTLHGTKHLRPSNNFWTILDQLGPEQSDEQLAADEADQLDQLLASLSLAQWRYVARIEARADVLAVADLGDTDALWRYLYKLGVPLE